MNLGLIIILIVIFGYISNWLNWRYINYKITHFLYYIGAFVHESSHALACVVTGAKIDEYRVFTSQPHVTHGKSKLPLLGGVIISSAPIFGGLLFLFLVNHYLLGEHFAVISVNSDWHSMLWEPLRVLAQLRPWEWQSLVMLLLFINIGAMIGPSVQDMKNVWPVLILLFFINIPPLADIGLLALSLIIVNIIIQIFLIVCISIYKAI